MQDSLVQTILELASVKKRKQNKQRILLDQYFVYGWKYKLFESPRIINQEAIDIVG